MEILYGRNTTSGKRNRPHSSGVFWVGEQVSELTTLL
jgi:hypothetical protein